MICLGGEVHQSVRSLVTNYTKENTRPKRRFEEWTGDKLAEMLLAGLLRELDQQGSSSSAPNLPGRKNDSLKQKKPQIDNADLKHLTGVMKGVAKMLTSLKDITLNYSELSASTIYGYMDSTHFLGMNLKSG